MTIAAMKRCLSGFIQKTRNKIQGLYKDFQALKYFFQGLFFFIDSEFDKAQKKIFSENLHAH